MPTESPTRSTSRPARSSSRAIPASYAVSTVILVPFAFMARRSGTRTGFMRIRLTRSMRAWGRSCRTAWPFHNEHQRNRDNENDAQQPDNIHKRNHGCLTVNDAVEHSVSLGGCRVPVGSTGDKHGTGTVDGGLRLRGIGIQAFGKDGAM